jgi:hypothetical protein
LLTIWTDAYAPLAGDDALFPYYRGQVLILSGKYVDGAKLILANWKNAQARDEGAFHREYTRAMLKAGQPLDAYLPRPDAKAAFREVANALAVKKDVKSLIELIALHRTREPDDAWADFYDGTIDESVTLFGAASEKFARAMVHAANEQDRNTFRYRAVNASVKAGRGMDAYLNVGPRDKTFRLLARLYSNAGKPDDLATLTAAFRNNAPEDSALPLWEAETAFLRGDYAAAAKILSENRAAIYQEKGNRWQFDDRLIRSLVRTRRLEIAVAEMNRTEANTIATRPRLTAIILANTGDISGATKAMDKELSDNDEVELSDLYGDPDLKTILQSASFADWRTAHPQPKQSR